LGSHRDFRCHLSLFDENVARGTGHTLTLIVGHDSVVRPNLNRFEGRFSVAEGLCSAE
jgi:hypothetical protein